MALRLVGTTEIASLLGVSRQRADQLTHAPDFPKPVATLAQGRVWERGAVEAWALEHRPGPAESQES